MSETRSTAVPPYRPGLPPIEDIQAHEARGGWWMVRSEVHLDMLRLVVEDGVVKENVPGGVYRAAGADLAAMRFRPCTTLGTPCPWPREEAQVAQPCPACGQLSAIAFAVRLSHQRISAKAILDAAASRAAQAGQRSLAEVQRTLERLAEGPGPLDRAAPAAATPGGEYPEALLMRTAKSQSDGLAVLVQQIERVRQVLQSGDALDEHDIQALHNVGEVLIDHAADLRGEDPLPSDRVRVRGEEPKTAERRERPVRVSVWRRGDQSALAAGRPGTSPCTEPDGHCQPCPCGWTLALTAYVAEGRIAASDFPYQGAIVYSRAQQEVQPTPDGWMELGAIAIKLGLSPKEALRLATEAIGLTEAEVAALRALETKGAELDALAARLPRPDAAASRAAQAGQRSQAEVQRTLERLAEGPRAIDRVAMHAQRLARLPEIDPESVIWLCGMLAGLGLDPEGAPLCAAFERLDDAHRATAPYIIAGALRLIFDIYGPPVALPEQMRQQQIADSAALDGGTP